jgi:hypothetical protein
VTDLYAVKLKRVAPGAQGATHFNLLTRAEVKMDNGFDRAVRVLYGDFDRSFGVS